MEYDITVPTNRFSNFIKDKVIELINNNKKCILYPRPKNGFIYPGVLMFDPSEISKHPIFLKEKWYKSIRDWIKFWKVGFSETITENILRYVFDESILEYSIEEDAKKYWNLEDYAYIHKFDTLKEENRCMISLVPSKKDDKIGLHIYMCNASDTHIVNILNLKVINESKGVLLYELNNKKLNGNVWYLDTINNYDSDDIINLTYIVEGKEKPYTEIYHIKHLEKIYNYVRRINFN